MAYNVTTDFGANNLVGDGSTDNTAHLTAIFALGSVAPGGATLYFPAGTYVFASEPAAVPAKTTIYGDGMNQTLIKGTRVAPSSNDVWQLSSHSNITLKDLQFTTTDDANAVSQGLNAAGGTGIVLERIKFTNTFNSGLRLSAQTQLLASQCEFTHIYQGVDASMISGSPGNSAFVGCRFYDNAGTTNTAHCVYLNGATVPSNVSLVGCVFSNWSGGQAVEVDGDEETLPAVCVTLDGCQFNYGAASIAPIIFNQAQACTVNNCQFYASGSVGLNGINITDCDAWAVTNCTFNNAGTVFGGIMIQAGNNANQTPSCGLIKGNQFFGGTSTFALTTAIGLYDSTYVLIEGNTFTGIGLGVVTYAVGNTSHVSGVTVRGNQFVIAAGATKRTSGGEYFGSATNTYAIASDGPATNIQFVDNVVSGFTYEAYFTQSSYTGQVSGFTYRCGNFGAPGTFGFANAAAPTGLVRQVTPSAAFSSATSGTVFSTLAS